MQTLTIPTIPFNEICEAINHFVSQAQDLTAMPITTEEEFSAYKEQQRAWEEAAAQFLDRSLSTKQYLYEFEQSGQPILFPGLAQHQQLPLQTRADHNKRQIVEKTAYLQHNIAIWEQCDLIKGQPVDVAGRAKYTMQQKLNFIMERLYTLDDGRNYYPLDILLQGNGFQHRGAGQLRQMAGILEQNGYIDFAGGLGEEVLAKISVAGQIYVEENLISYKEDYSGIPNEKAMINELIDHLKEQLCKLTAGQEVLFEELEDLRALYGKLSKKNWGEILKGKLFDLALNKVISKETFMFIFSTFTGHELKLLT